MKDTKKVKALQPLKKHIEKDIEVNVAQLSKRQFLRSAIAAAGAMTISGLIQEERPAEINEYTKGLLWLHEKSLNEEKEHVAYFVTTKNSPGEWIKQKEGKTLCAEFDMREISKIIAGQPSNVHIVHTHTLAAVQEPQRQYFKGRDISSREIDALPQQPPTFIEVLTSKYFSEMYCDTGVDITYMIMTPQGMWQYSIDSTSEFMDHYYAYSRREDEFIQKVSRDDAVKLFLQHNPGIMHDMSFEEIRKQFLSPSSIFYSILPHYLKQDAHALITFRKEHIDPNHDFEDTLNLEQDMTLRMTFACPGEKQRILNEYITLAKRLGINLSFTPIDRIKKDEYLLCIR